MAELDDYNFDLSELASTKEHLCSDCFKVVCKPEDKCLKGLSPHLCSECTV